MKKIALFDLDHTIISVDSMGSFIIFILKKYPFNIIHLPYLLFMTLLRFLKLITMEKYKSAWLIFIKNIDENELDVLSKEFVRETILPKIKPEIHDELNRLKENDYLLVMATASFEFYVKYIFEYLGFDYFFGTKTKYFYKKYIINGKNCKGKEKINRIREIIKPDSIVKAGSLGYSDCLSDLPFLALTETFLLVDKKKWYIKRKIY
jgi:HAD superfamily hydrolase (TIGR01490 family)